MNALVLSADLFFSSKLTAAARNVAATASVCGTATQAIESASTTEFDLVLIDLTHDEARKDLPSIIKQLRNVGSQDTRIIGFGPHVQSEVLRRAEQAGCDAILTRGQLNSQLDTIFLA